MLNPMSRIAKIVSVFATAHMDPASKAQTIRCGERCTSARMEDVPIIKAGKLHRARKTPTTMISEITSGETPMETSFVGASAVPSQAPAVKPQSTPKACNFFARQSFWTTPSVREIAAGCIFPQNQNFN